MSKLSKEARQALERLLADAQRRPPTIAARPQRYTRFATRNRDGTFAPGHSGNPKGRPRGSRDKGYVVITPAAVNVILDWLAEQGIDFEDLIEQINDAR